MFLILRLLAQAPMQNAVGIHTVTVTYENFFVPYL